MPTIFPLDTTFNPIERVTGAVATIDSNHGQIHAKRAFSLNGEITVAQSQVGVLQITVPVGAYVHLQDLSFISNGGPSSVTIMEDAALTSAAGASDLTPVNHNRIGAVASVVTVKTLANAGVTNGSAPLQLAMLPIYGTGAGAARVGGETTAAQERVLNNKVHTIAFAHSVAGPCKFGYKLFWYEETAA